MAKKVKIQLFLDIEEDYDIIKLWDDAPHGGKKAAFLGLVRDGIWLRENYSKEALMLDEMERIVKHALQDFFDTNTPSYERKDVQRDVVSPELDLSGLASDIEEY